MLLDVYREQARRLQARLATLLTEQVPYNFWLDTVADLHGVQGWNSLSALLRRQHSDAALPDDLAWILDQSLLQQAPTDRSPEPSPSRSLQPHALLTSQLSMRAPVVILDASGDKGLGDMVNIAARLAGRPGLSRLDLAKNFAWNPFAEASSIEAQANILLALGHGRDIGRGLYASHCQEVAIVLLEALTAAGLPVTPQGVTEFMLNPAHDIDDGLALRRPDLGWDYGQVTATAVRTSVQQTLDQVMASLTSLAGGAPGVMAGFSSPQALPALRRTLREDGALLVSVSGVAPEFRAMLAQLVAAALSEAMLDSARPAAVLVHGEEPSALLRPLAAAAARLPGAVVSRI